MGGEHELKQPCQNFKTEPVPSRQGFSSEAPLSVTAISALARAGQARGLTSCQARGLTSCQARGLTSCQARGLNIRTAEASYHPQSVSSQHGLG